MARFDVDSHRLQTGDDFQFHSSGAAAAALEVAARVVRQRPDRIGREQEELDLRCDEVPQTGRLGLIQKGAQRPAAVAWIWFAARRYYLADEPRTRHTGRLHHGEGRGIWAQIHVRLDLASQTLDGRAVEPLPVCEHCGDAAGGNGHGLDRAGDVGELQLDLLNTGLFDARQNALDCAAVDVAQAGRRSAHGRHGGVCGLAYQFRIGAVCRAA